MDGEGSDPDFDPLATTGDAPPPPPPPADLAPGDRLGRYKLIGRIGGGAMGVVWRARDPKLDRDVAIKVVHPKLARIPDAAARLLREARALAKVQHRAVVAVHDAGQDADRLYLAMELVEGTTLGAILRRRSPDDLRDWRGSLALVVEAGLGLEAAHAAGVLHRDFKPDNVLVSNAGRVCVADFGLAEIVAGVTSAPQRPSTDAGDSWRVSDADSLTLTGAVVGTPAYMSPEQLRSRVVDGRSDQFGFCVTAYEALYGHRPFDVQPQPDQPPAAALLAEIEAGRVVAAPRESTVPRWLRDVVVRGLAVDPAARWPDMRAVLAALRPPRRRRWWIAAAAAAIVIAVAVVMMARRAPATRAATRLGPMPMWSRVVSSPDRARVAYVDEARVSVRDLTAPATPPRQLALGGGIDHVEFAGADQIVASVIVDGGLVLRRWYLGSGVVEDVAALAGWSQWYGDVARGRLVARTRADDRSELAVVAAGDAVTAIASSAHTIHQIAIAPGGHRIAWMDEDGPRGRILIHDLDRGTTIASAPIDELAGVTWAAPDRILYSTGAGDQPALWLAVVAADLVGAPGRVYGADVGWFSYLGVVGDRIRFVDTTTVFSARWIDRVDPAASRELDVERVADSLGWDADGAALGWHRGSGRIVRIDPGGATTPLAATLDGDVGNATRSGGVAIVALRRPGGRELVAVSLVDGARRWSRRAGEARLVRCAGDDHPPCVVVETPPEGVRLRVIDPDTGAVGDVLPATLDRIEDVAISADGGELIASDGSPALYRLALADPAAGFTPYLRAPLATVRGLAHDPGGGMVVTGTKGPELYQLIQVRPDAAPIVVAQTSSEILSVPRPSPDGRTILVLARRYRPELSELRGAL